MRDERLGEAITELDFLLCRARAVDVCAAEIRCFGGFLASSGLVDENPVVAQWQRSGNAPYSK